MSTENKEFISEEVKEIKEKDAIISAIKLILNNIKP